MLLGHEKVSILNLPTELEYLPNISRDLGIELYIKRDDLTPLAMGGNKLRKLEYLLKDAQDQGATMLLTVGGAQTNHGRLTCAVARKYGLKGAIVCVDPYPGELSANLLLDGMMGCDVYLRKPEEGRSEGELMDETVAKVKAAAEADGEKVYYIPIGGSNELGILGYYECAVELASQVKGTPLENARIISPIGSMGTYMGLAVGIQNEGLPFHLTGIGISPKPQGLTAYALEYYQRVKDFYGLSVNMTEKDFHVTSDYDRGGYNNPCKEVRQAMYYMAEKEALILDPCYTGKAFAGLLEMVKAGRIAPGEKVIFLHTGGSPGISTPFHRIEIEKEREKYIHIV
ncbi:MAG: pyridoxal-phosphate dependent enzyme [Firmicutes bacterium]|nr:pyridoxal-phosphate dependent enzyme [Bacillota bacterium]